MSKVFILLSFVGTMSTGMAMVPRKKNSSRKLLHQWRWVFPLLLIALVQPGVIASPFLGNSKVVSYLGHRYSSSSLSNNLGLVQNSLLSMRNSRQTEFLFSGGSVSSSANLVPSTLQRGRRGAVTMNMNPFNFLDMLENLERGWVFFWDLYKDRDEILPKVGLYTAKFMRKHSVRAAGIIGVSFLATEIIARLGFIGEKGEGLIDYAREERVAIRKLAREAVREDMPHLIAGLRPIDRFLDLPDKVKFATALSFGAMGSRVAIKTGVFVLKATLSAFVVIEVLAFAGVIGERGESITEWVEDNCDKYSAQVKKIQKFRQSVRKHLDIQHLEDMYMEAIMDEQYASVGLATGSIIGILGLA